MSLPTLFPATRHLFQVSPPMTIPPPHPTLLTLLLPSSFCSSNVQSIKQKKPPIILSSKKKSKHAAGTHQTRCRRCECLRKRSKTGPSNQHNEKNYKKFTRISIEIYNSPLHLGVLRVPSRSGSWEGGRLMSAKNSKSFQLVS